MRACSHSSLIVPTTPLRAITVLSSMAAGMIAMYALSASRASLGTYGTRSNRMLVELRTRQQQLAVLPALPEGYRAEAAVVGRSAMPSPGTS